MTIDDFAEVGALASRCLRRLLDEDWSESAADLDWTCRQTLDHMIDCVFSYALQLAARAASGFLPFSELHATDEASPGDLLVGFTGVVQMFGDVARNAAPSTVASDGVLALSVEDWCARAAYEVALHTSDIATGLGTTWRLPDDLCRSVTASEALWMFDRRAAAASTNPWTSLLVGSGRTPRG